MTKQFNPDINHRIHPDKTCIEYSNDWYKPLYLPSNFNLSIYERTY